MSDFPVDPFGYHSDPVVAAIVAHQRHRVDACLCGWSVLGASHSEHVAAIVRPLIEAEVRDVVAREIDARNDELIEGVATDAWEHGYEVALWDAARVARGSDG